MNFAMGIVSLIGQLAPLAVRWANSRAENRAAIEAEADAAIAEWRATRDAARRVDDAIAAEADALLDAPK